MDFGTVPAQEGIMRQFVANQRRHRRLVLLPSLLASLEKILKVTILRLNEGRKVEVRQRVLMRTKNTGIRR